MSPFLGSDNRLELIGTVTALFWLFGGLFSDGILVLASMAISLGIMVYLGILSFIPYLNYHYDLHIAAFRRMIIGFLADLAYRTGANKVTEDLVLFDVTLPVAFISRLAVTSLIVFWFGSRYFDQLRDPNIPGRLYPMIIARGLLRGAMIAGLLVAMFVRNRGDDIGPDIEPQLAVPYLFVAYLIEPFLFGFMQFFNQTMSRVELTVGNARLPSVALKESFISNFFILFFTVRYHGVVGEEWQLLRVFYLIGAVVSLVYSMDAVKRFKQNPLGTQAIGMFFESTPDILKDLDLEKRMGMVVDKETMVDLSSKAGLKIEPGSIVIPLEETKGKMSALVIGNAQNIVDDGKQKVAERLEGVSTVLIPKKEFKSLSKDYVSQ